MNDLTPSACPSSDQLEQMVAGERTDESIQDHVDGCDTCRAGAERIRANNELLQKFVAQTARDDRTGGVQAAIPVIAGYEILGELYRGGQGVVHKAYHPATKRHVAIKTLLPRTLASARQRRRFEREIEIIAKLRHPNIVTLYDSGVTDDGRDYFAMEYLRGLALDGFVRRFFSDSKSGSGRDGIKQVLRLFIKICGAVQYAHQHGIIHRDLKPGNILVDAEGEPHVLDFGLAKALGQDGPGGALLATQTGEFMGTFAYAAPEQVKGDPEQVDTRADVYALGVILYEMLTGTTPYPVSGTLSDAIRHIAETEPTRPSFHRPQINGEIDTILLKTLSKNRERRYQSVETLRGDIERHLAGEPIDAKRDSTWYLMSKMVHRHRVGVAFGGTFVLLLATATIVSSVQVLRAERARADTAAVTNFLSKMISTVNPNEVSGGAENVKEMLDRASADMESGFAAGPVAEAQLRRTIGKAYHALESFDAAERHLKRALEIGERTLGLEHRDTLQSMAELAGLCCTRNRFVDAERLFRQALTLQERFLGENDPDTLRTMRELGHVYETLDRLSDALPLYERAAEKQRTILGAEHEETLESLNNLGVLYKKLKRYDEAERLDLTVLEARRRVLRPDHPYTLQTLNNLGVVYRDQDRFAEAEPLFVEYLESSRKRSLGGNSDAALALTNLGATRCGLGNLSSAEELLRESADMFTKLRGPGYSMVGNARGNLGQVLTRMERFCEAENELLAAQRILDDTRGRKHSLARKNRQRIVALYEAWNQPEKADEYRKQLLAETAE